MTLAPLLYALALAATPAEVQGRIDAGDLEGAQALLSALPEAQRPAYAGQIAMQRGAWGEAVAAFERAAADLDPAPPELSLYLAHAYLQAGRPQDSLRAARDAAALADELVAQPLVEARARRALGDVAEAHAVLTRAVEAFPDAPRVRLELVALLHEAGLRGAARAAAAPLGDADLDAEARLAVFHLLYTDPQARPLLERLAARAPQDPETVAHLAHAYAADGQRLAAARLFDRAAALGGAYTFEAADQSRVAGRPRDALRLNARVRDPARRLEQRITILFDAGAYARVVRQAQGAPLADPAVTYRVAYAHYALGDFAAAAARARALEGTGYAASGRALLESMGREAAR